MSRTRHRVRERFTRQQDGFATDLNHDKGDLVRSIARIRVLFPLRIIAPSRCRGRENAFTLRHVFPERRTDSSQFVLFRDFRLLVRKWAGGFNVLSRNQYAHQLANFQGLLLRRLPEKANVIVIMVAPRSPHDVFHIVKQWITHPAHVVAFELHIERVHHELAFTHVLVRHHAE